MKQKLIIKKIMNVIASLDTYYFPTPCWIGEPFKWTFYLFLEIFNPKLHK